MTSKLRIVNPGASDYHDTIAGLIASHRHLPDIVQWLVSQGRTDKTLSDVVMQDEYTYDVTVKFTDGIYLIYDVTWLGRIAGVSVWDHKPTADEMLQDRLAQGWKPQASSLNDGEIILGYAACLADQKERVGNKVAHPANT